MNLVTVAAEEAISAWTSLLGAAHVCVDAQRLRALETTTFATYHGLLACLEPATTEEVRAHLTVKFEDFPPLQIYLRADKNTPAKKIREVVDMATEVGAIDLIFGVYGN